jgi:hypothetical protein
MVVSFRVVEGECRDVRPFWRLRAQKSPDGWMPRGLERKLTDADF